MRRFVSVLFFVLFSIGCLGQIETAPLKMWLSPVMRSKTPPTGFPGFKKMDKDDEYWTIDVHLENIGLPSTPSRVSMRWSITSPVRNMILTPGHGYAGDASTNKPGTIIIHAKGQIAWPLIFMSPKSGKEVLARYRYTYGADGTTFEELIDEVLTLEPNETANVYMTFLVPKWMKEKDALLRLEAAYPVLAPLRADTPELRHIRETADKETQKFNERIAQKLAEKPPKE